MIVQMYEALGIDCAASLLVCVCILMLPIPFIFFKYGPAIRRKRHTIPSKTKMRQIIDTEPKTRHLALSSVP